MDDESISYEVGEDTVEINPFIKEVAEKGSVLKGTLLCPGCGPQLGLKLALQLLKNSILVVSSGCMRLVMKSLTVPCFHGGTNAIAAASAMSKSGDNTVLCFIGDGAAAMHLGALQAAAERNDNLICICYNNQGYCNLNSHFKKIKEFARIIKASYVATASISHMEDYITKIKKASELTGFRFIDLFSPCPVTMGFDSSNIIEVGKLAVDSGLWPLYEIEKGEVNITERPRKLESLERYLELVKNDLSEDERDMLQLRVRRKWKALVNGYV